MGELTALAIGALPGLAALAAGALRWSVWRLPRRIPVPLRLPLLLLVALAIGACHSTHRDQFAKGPVPLEKLAFREPIVLSRDGELGMAGEPVPTRNGLLASYFAQADYRRLDHQKIDTKVDFFWDAIGAPPVTSSDAFDTDEGCGSFCGLPPRWGIWSVAWEGYLEARTEGQYTLGIHVNNGGWLQMKDETTGGLRTIVAAPGGPSFEGTVTADISLELGRHYIRFSFFQNGPPTGVARLLWRPPGTSALDVVPTSALWTQSARKGVMFLHGIAGDVTDLAFDPLLSPLRSRFVFRPYQYVHDRGLAAGGSCQSREIPTIPPSVEFPVDIPSETARTLCDSNDDVGINAVRLEQDIREFIRDEQLSSVTLIGNSMGGAIIRAYLAYATVIDSETLNKLDDVLFLQGVQQGSYLGTLYTFVDEDPVLAPIAEQIAVEVKTRLRIDVERPAFTDLTPQSEMYQFVNRAGFVPDHIEYANVASDIRVRPIVMVAPWSFTISVPIGDYAILQGTDDPTATPPLGGARFDPGANGQQWILPRDQFILFAGPLPISLGDPLEVPEAHTAIGRKLDQIHVMTPTGPRRLDLVLVEWVSGVRGP